LNIYFFFHLFSAEFFPAALTILETETRPEPDIVIESGK